MKIIDISWPISNDMVTYKDKGDVKIEATRTFERDGGRESRLTCGTHTGTHVDAPAHFLEDGKTLDQMDLSQLIGKCALVDMTHIMEKITAQDLKDCDLQDCKIVLFKTKNSDLPAAGKFDLNFIYLDKTGAEFLAQKNLTAVGIDSLGIERDQPDHDTHVTLFNSGVLIIEGLRLKNVDPGAYNLVCLPLSIIGADGAPARAILFK